MFIKIEDVEVGDEILYPSGTTFKKVKVLRLPVKDINGYWGTTKCQIYKGSHGYDCLINDYNTTIYLYFAYRELWLINKNK